MKYMRYNYNLKKLYRHQIRMGVEEPKVNSKRSKVYLNSNVYIMTINNKLFCLSKGSITL